MEGEKTSNNGVHYEENEKQPTATQEPSYQHEKIKEQKLTPKVNFSFKKKKRAKGKGTGEASEKTEAIKFLSNHQDDDEPSTIAAAAELETLKREKEGTKLVIPVPKRNQNEPLLQGFKRRSMGLQENDDDAAAAADSNKIDEAEEASSTKAKQLIETKDANNEDDQAAELALIQSAHDHQESARSTNNGTNFSAKGSLVISNQHTSTNNILAQKKHKEREENDDEKYKRDIQNRAQDLSVDSKAYVSVPIAEFGAAMLRGMGWTGNDDDGSRSKTKDEEVRIQPRPQRLGLGATPLPPSKRNSNGAMASNGSTKSGKRHYARKGGTMADLAHVQKEEEEERKYQALLNEKKKQDLQITLQVGSIVYVADMDSERDVREGQGGERRAKMVKIAGVPGLNRVLVRYEGEREDSHTSVKKSNVLLVDRKDLEERPFDGEIEHERSMSRSKSRSRSRSRPHAKERNIERRRRSKSRSRSPSPRAPSNTKDRQRKWDLEGREYPSRDEDRSRSRRDRSRSRDRHDRDRKSRRDRKEHSGDRGRHAERERDRYDDRDRDYRKYERSGKRRRERYDADGEEGKRGDSRKRRRTDDRRRDERSDRQIRDQRRDRDEHIDRDRERGQEQKQEANRDRKERPKQETEYWLTPNIRVRVVSKKIAKGRQFKEKGVVLDVLKRGAEATIQMNNGEILERVPERYLETALPKVGGNAIILTGANKFEKGKLLERNSSRRQGVIQLFEDMNVKTLSLDDIAEYCGVLDDTLADY